jgi:hypothetical protein
LSRDRFLVKFTASRALRDKLELARDLTSHADPTGSLEVLLERALDLLIAEQLKHQRGLTPRPAGKPRPAKDTHVTRAARREVVARDGWRCSFVADDGRRCEARAFLEFDHETPKGRGGSSRSENLRLLCRAHNRAAAERVYGVEHTSLSVAESRGDGRGCTVRECLATYDRERVRGDAGVFTVRERLATYDPARGRDPDPMGSGGHIPAMHSAPGATDGSRRSSRGVRGVHRLRGVHEARRALAEAS